MALSTEEIAEIRRLSEQHQKNLTEAADRIATLWKSQLDIALATKDEDVVKGSLGPKPAYFDANTNCPCTPGGGGKQK